MLKSQRTHLYKGSSAFLLATNSVIGRAFRPELLSEVPEDSHHTTHTATSCLIRKSAFFTTPSEILRLCVIAEHIMLIGAGITGRFSLPHAV